jgi:hypothetical protein
MTGHQSLEGGGIIQKGTFSQSHHLVAVHLLKGFSQSLHWLL